MPTCVECARPLLETPEEGAVLVCSLTCLDQWQVGEDLMGRWTSGGYTWCYSGPSALGPFRKAVVTLFRDKTDI